MKFNLDANTLIYLIKSQLNTLFFKLVNSQVEIDTSVFDEVVNQGIKKGYSDARLAKNWLEENRIPIIPVDVKEHLPLFNDAGETSCYLLAKEKKSICISSDNRAIKKLKMQDIKVLQIDSFFYSYYCKTQISKKKIIEILDVLENIYATTSERKAFFLERMIRREEDE